MRFDLFFFFLGQNSSGSCEEKTTDRNRKMPTLLLSHHDLAWVSTCDLQSAQLALLWALVEVYGATRETRVRREKEMYIPLVFE